MSEEQNVETADLNEVELPNEIETKTAEKPARVDWKEVSRLRNEAATNRVKALEAQAALTQAEKDFEKRLADRESQVRLEAQNDARTDRAMARLESLATKDGLLDPDLVSMIDASSITFDEAGKINNAQELVDAFKASKPHLFAAQATSSVAKTPKTGSTEAKKATEMTEAEYRAYKQSKGLSF